MAEIITISSDSDDEVKAVPDLKSSHAQKKENNEVDCSENNESDVSIESESLLNLEKLQPNAATATKSCGKENDGDSLMPESQKSLFDRFLFQCEPLLDQKRELSPTKILSSLKKEHGNATDDFKSSHEYRDMLLRALAKATTNANIYVIVNDIYTQLKRHNGKRKEIQKKDGPQLDDTNPKRVKLTKVFPEKQTNISEASVKHSKDKMHGESENPSNSTKVSSNKLDDRIKRLEELLQNISKEIKRLQAHELSLDEMDEEDSTYVVEDKLKKRFMKVYERICQLKKVSLKTGRLNESKISVTSTRYPEVNKKVEKYVNKAEKFPDFYEIMFLVKRASKQSNLFLQSTEIKKLSEELFKEVGKKLQERRHYDFIYNFGSYLIDQKKAMEDPADEHPDLKKQLEENQKVGESAINDVLESFVQKQNELDTVNQQNTSSDKGEKESEDGSEPPSEPQSEEEDSDEKEQEDDLIIKEET